MEEILTLKNILLYLLIINLIGFLAMGIDKRRAQKNQWRIPENSLLWITLLGRRNWHNRWNVYV